MSMLLRVTGAWTQLLSDWLDREALPAPAIRARLAAFAPDDVVTLKVWRDVLDQAAALRPGLLAPGLTIGAGVKPHHVGVLGYLVLASDNLGEAMAAYQRYDRLFYGVDLAEVRMLPDGEVSVDKVATAMHQSTRTLQRRLAERNLTWQHMLDNTRMQLARQYLNDRALSVAEIAVLLGFSEQSAFTRAFKRWTGQTPLSFRQQGAAGSNN